MFCFWFQIRIWARRKAIDLGQGNYALNVTGPILDFFQSYYNIAYPLTKSGDPAFITALTCVLAFPIIGWILGEGEGALLPTITERESVCTISDELI